MSNLQKKLILRIKRSRKLKTRIRQRRGMMRRRINYRKIKVIQKGNVN